MLRIANHYVSIPVFLLLTLETAILFASVYIGASLRFADLTAPLTGEFDSFVMSALAFSTVMVLSMSALGMYQPAFHDGLKATFLRLVPSCLLGFVLLTLIFYIFPDLYLGRGVVGFVFAIAAPSILVTRVVFYISARSTILNTRVLFVGAGPLAKECSTLAKASQRKHKYNIVGYVRITDEAVYVPETELLPMEGTMMQMVRKHRLREIIVALHDRRGGALPIRDLLACKLNGIKITDAAAFFERDACQIRVDSLQPSWLVFGNGFDQGLIRTVCKKVFDVVVSIGVLIVASPILLITAILIYVEDRGPVFYRQERVGKDNKTFGVLKFRSMRTDAEKGGTPQWASARDPRTTRVGRVIRLLRIDEFPQILNVLKGDMSFVGPRPERPFFVDQFCEEVPFYNVRHSVKPGITGMAQVRYQYGASVEDAVQKLQYDLYYVKNNSLFLDLMILIDTLQVVLLGKGSR